MIKKLFIVMFPFLLLASCSGFMVKHFPLHVLDEEIPYYLENQEFSKQHDGYYRVLIMGDSTAKAAYLPAYLSTDTYNFSLGGATPIEEYYCLKKYLEHNKAPEYLIVSFTPDHLMVANTFWKRSVYFHRLKYLEAKEVLDNLELFTDDAGIGREDQYSTLCAYYSYSPLRYFDAFTGALSDFGRRYQNNLKAYNCVKKNNGAGLFSLVDSECCNNLNLLSRMEDFIPSECIDFYLRKMIQLCVEHDIEFIFISSPMNESSYAYLTKKRKILLEKYTSYLEELRNDYPEADISREIIHMDDIYFGDGTHLNYKGNKEFSIRLKNSYSNIF